MLSLLLCNFLFFSSPLSRKECVFCRSTTQCQGAKQPILVSDSVTESQWCLKDSKNSSLCTHNCDATWGNAIDIIPNTSCTLSEFVFHLPATRITGFFWRWQTRKKNTHNKLSADEACLSVGYCAKHSCCARACLQMKHRLMMTERMREQEGATEERKDRAGVRRVEGVMTRSAQDRGGDRGGSVSDRLLVAPLWRLWSSDPSRNLPYYKASPLHTGTTTKWSNYI